MSNTRKIEEAIHPSDEADLTIINTTDIFTYASKIATLYKKQFGDQFSYHNYLLNSEQKIIHKKINLLSNLNGFSADEIHALPYCKTRILSTHGNINSSYHVHITHLISDDNNMLSIATKDILPLFHGKQQALFLMSCKSNAIHRENIDDVMGDSILITCIDAKLYSSIVINREIELYISQLTYLSIDIKTIILSLLARFPLSIGIKVPNKPSIILGDSFYNNTESLQLDLQKAKEYLDVNEHDLFFFNAMLEDHLKRRNELNYFFILLLNWINLGDLQKRMAIKRIENTPLDDLKKLKTYDGHNLINFVIDSVINVIIHDEKDIFLLITALIKAGLCDNHQEKFKLLYWVVTRRHNDLLTWLTSNGFNLNMQDDDEFTLLHHSVITRDEELVDYLLERKINPDITSRGRTALFFAVVAGDTQIVKQLIKKNANVNIASRSGFTCLHCSYKHKHTEIIRHLINAGANVDATTLHQNTAMHVYVKHEGGLPSLKVLLKSHANINSQNDQGETPLHLAVRRKRRKMINALIKHGARVDIKDKNGNTPIFYAKDQDIRDKLEKTEQLTLTACRQILFASIRAHHRASPPNDEQRQVSRNHLPS